ncbi:hypothetical protein BDV93DRAFT_594212 [Ceratobasidium sp. AG-I]|nr:hypothetical protein BDV93DRAFT_594212 [Ceratobasidium sp. AG-I]
MYSGTPAGILHHRFPNLHRNIRPIVFAGNNERVEGAVVNWCLSLGTTPLRRIEMHKARNTNSHFFVLFTLANDASFVFERAVGANPPAPDPSDGGVYHDRIIVAMEESGLQSDLLVRVKFPGGFLGGLRFPLAVCHRIQKTDWGDRTPNSEAFAWMLTSLVARKQLPSISDFLPNSPTILEELCSSVCLDLQTTGKSLWENDFRAEVQNTMQRQIALALHNYIMPQPDGDTTPTNHAGEQVVLSSLIAWVKFLAMNPDRDLLSIWDRAWDTAWSKKWDEEWTQTWRRERDKERRQARNQISIMQSNPVLRLNIGAAKPFVPSIPDVWATGRAAGRSPTNIKAVRQIIIDQQKVLSLGNRAPNTSRAASSGDILTNANPPNQEHISLQVNWFDRWDRIYHLERELAWYPAWETAAESAWVTVWRAAEEQRRTKLRDEPAAETAPTVELVPLTSPQTPRRKRFRDSVRKVIAMLPTRRRPRHSKPLEAVEAEQKRLADTVPHKLSRKPIELLAGEALKSTETTSHTTDADLSLLAQHLFESSEELDEEIKDMAEKDPALWSTLFVAVWKVTWRHSWTEAWLAVWNEVASQAVQSGIEYEGPPQQNITINDAIPAAYEKILVKITPTSQNPVDQEQMPQNPEASGAHASIKHQMAIASSSHSPPAQPDITYALQQARLMFKELNRLSLTMESWIPTPHEEVMRITYFLGKKECTETHESLQKKYKKLLKENNPKEEAYQTHLRDIAHVWETALSRVQRMSVTSTTPNANTSLDASRRERPGPSIIQRVLAMENSDLPKPALDQI